MTFSPSYVNGKTIRDALHGSAMNLDTNTIMTALFTNAISGQSKDATETYGSGSYTAASGTAEVVSAGYTAGGGTSGTLANPGISTPAAGKWIFTDSTSTRIWGGTTPVTFNAMGAVIYNFSVANRVLACINFGEEISVVEGTFTITWNSTNGIFYATY